MKTVPQFVTFLTSTKADALAASLVIISRFNSSWRQSIVETSPRVARRLHCLTPRRRCSIHDIIYAQFTYLKISLALFNRIHDDHQLYTPHY